MSTVSIPDWTAEGVLPPIDVQNPTSEARSPYRVALTDFVLRFATSPERVQIIHGLLNYRAAMNNVGLVAGFQWLDGSFLEDVETIRQRPPGDVDVVTFFHLPPSRTQLQIWESDKVLFDHDKVKDTYLVDGYVVGLESLPEQLIAVSHYWYGVWSHRRGDLDWKGYVEIDLAPSGDQDARNLLQACAGTRGAI